MLGRRFEVREYVLPNGTSPFRAWLGGLDVGARARIAARVTRMEAGNLGDSKPVGGGVFEARFMFGPGYRIYFGIHHGRVILLLAGGNKSTQRSDITRAAQYWREFIEAEDE